MQKKKEKNNYKIFSHLIVAMLVYTLHTPLLHNLCLVMYLGYIFILFWEIQYFWENNWETEGLKIINNQFICKK